MAQILIIDDDAHVRDMLRHMLERIGHIVEAAPDGKEGVEMYRKKPCELVITDILMPEKEGIQTIMELRGEFPDIKIIAISGGGSVGPDTYLTMARELGADRTLTKPFSMNDLADVISELI